VLKAHGKSRALHVALVCSRARIVCSLIQQLNADKMTALAFIGGVFGPRRRRRRSTPSPPNTRFPTASGGFIGTPKSRFDDDALLADTDCCSARRSSGCPARSLTTTGRYLTFMSALHSPPSLASLALRARDLAHSLVARTFLSPLSLLLRLLAASSVQSISYETGR